MTIGIDASRAFSNQRTGTENYSYAITRALAKLDQTNSYILFVRGGADIDSPATQGVPLRGWPKNFRFVEIGWPLLWTQVGLASQTFVEKLDVLFIPAHTLPVVRKPGLKTVVTIHDLGAEYLAQYHQFPHKYYLNLATGYAAAHADALIAVSQATKNDLIEKLKVNEKRIHVIYEGYDKEKFKVHASTGSTTSTSFSTGSLTTSSLRTRSSKFKTDAQVNTLKRFDIQKSYLLFVGTVQPRKNLVRLIEAFSRMVNSDSLILNPSSFIIRDLSLVIVGSKGWLADDIYQAPAKYGVASRVKFLGHVDDVYLPALYSGAKALVFPSLYEGFGLPILEAMAVGCPVLTSGISSMPEVAEDAALYVNPYDIENITSGLIDILDRNKGQELRVKGLEQVKKFSWEKAARATLKVLEDVFKNQNAGKNSKFQPLNFKL